VVYIFFNLRQIGIQLAEPFGFETRHIQIQEYLMRGLIVQRQLMNESFEPLTGRDTISADGQPPDFCGPLHAKFDSVFMDKMKQAESFKQISLMQGRFGFPGITEEDRDKGLTSVSTDKDELELAKNEAPADAEEEGRWTMEKNDGVEDQKKD